MKIFKKIFNKKKTVKNNIYNIKLNCPYCSSGDFYLGQLWGHTYKEHPDKVLFNFMRHNVNLSDASDKF